MIFAHLSLSHRSSFYVHSYFLFQVSFPYTCRSLFTYHRCNARESITSLSQGFSIYTHASLSHTSSFHIHLYFSFTGLFLIYTQSFFTYSRYDRESIRSLSQGFSIYVYEPLPQYYFLFIYTSVTCLFFLCTFAYVSLHIQQVQLRDKKYN